MKIDKIYNIIILFFLVNFSKVISHNLKLFGIHTNEIECYKCQKHINNNRRNLTEMSPLRLSRKRRYNCSLTIDEIQRLFNILHAEVVLLDDLVASLMNFLSRNQNPNDFKNLISGKVNQRLSRLIPGYPDLRKKNMEKRLVEQMEEIIKMLPISKDEILFLHEFLRLEIDQSIEILNNVAMEETDDGRNWILNDLSYIRVRLIARLRRYRVIVNDDLITAAVLRLRRRILDILEYHYDMPSQAIYN